jgi:CBS domain-containing protein
MMGGALGGVEAMFLPHEGAGFWPLVSMGAILGGTMRSPFTGVIFALELTHDVNMLLPLLLAVTIAYAFTVLTLRRSILTGKVARRGSHPSREYAVDPLDILFVRDVMRTNVAALPARLTGRELAHALHTDRTQRPGQHPYPLVDDEQRLVGVLTRGDLERFAKGGTEPAHRDPVVAYPDEPLRVVAHRMSGKGLTRFPVVNNDRERKLTGMVALSDLLRARTRSLEEERHRERVLRLHLPLTVKKPVGRC